LRLQTHRRHAAQGQREAEHKGAQMR
jgi:hypothetical protein